MLNIFHSNGATFLAYATQCRDGWLPVIDIVYSSTETVRNQRLELFAAEVDAVVVAFGDASYLANSAMTSLGNLAQDTDEINNVVDARMSASVAIQPVKKQLRAVALDCGHSNVVG